MHKLCFADFAMLAIGMITVNTYLYESQSASLFTFFYLYNTELHEQRYCFSCFTSNTLLINYLHMFDTYLTFSK
jgi:hypothetical protein